RCRFTHCKRRKSILLRFEICPAHYMINTINLGVKLAIYDEYFRVCSIVQVMIANVKRSNPTHARFGDIEVITGGTKGAAEKGRVSWLQESPSHSTKYDQIQVSDP